MEMHAVVGQIFILMLCVGNAGIQIADMLFLQNFLKNLI